MFVKYLSIYILYTFNKGLLLELFIFIVETFKMCLLNLQNNPPAMSLRVQGKGVVGDEIKDHQELIERSYQRIDLVEKFLATKDIDEEQRSQLESELSDLKEILKRSEKDLQELNYSNRETTKIAFLIILLMFFLYCIYVILTNKN